MLFIISFNFVATHNYILSNDIISTCLTQQILKWPGNRISAHKPLTVTCIKDTSQEDFVISYPKLILKPTAKAVVIFPQTSPTTKNFVPQNPIPEVRIDKCPKSGGASWMSRINGGEERGL